MKAFLLAIALISSQTTDKGSIEGLILGIGFQPVAGAQVRAFWEVPPGAYDPSDVPQTTTGTDGRFAIRNVAPGRYRIVVNAVGYAPQGFGAETPGRVASNTGTVISVESGRTTQGITVHLVGDSIISGRLTSLTGQPLVRMEVRAARRVFDERGSSRWAVDGKAQTNDLGEYRIAGLAPGRYFILGQSVPDGIIESEGRRASSEGGAGPVLPTPGLFPPTFYPGTTDSLKASSIDVQAGIESRNVDFVLSQPPRYRIRGRVHDPQTPQLPVFPDLRRNPDGEISSRVGITLFPTNIEFIFSIGASAHASVTGYFEVSDVIPGTYWVTAQMPPTPTTPEQRQALALPGANLSEIVPAPARGVAIVKVTDSDVGNVEITIVRNLALKGRITIEGQSAISPSSFVGMKVELWGVDPTGGLGGPMGRSIMDPAGRFSIDNLVPSEYRLKVRGLPPELYVKEARFGNIDATSQSIQIVSESLPPVDIVLARGSEVSGTIMNALGQEVVIIPEDSRRADLYRTAKTDAAGRFLIQGVAPGDYRAFAWQKMEPYVYFDREFVRQFEDRGTAVRVTESSRTAIEVKVIP